MRKALTLCCYALALSLPPARLTALELDAPGQPAIISFLDALRADNQHYLTTHRADFFIELAKGQSPIATVVSCTDARIQHSMFDRTPEGQLYTVRNLGNQLHSSEGSIEYGIQVLHTPLLIFIAHTRCGAIALASNRHAKLSAPLKRELEPLAMAEGVNNIEGVKRNLQRQVQAAMVKFDAEISRGHLFVIGAVLDIADDLHQGPGRLHLHTLNGQPYPNHAHALRKLIYQPAKRLARD